MSYLIRFKYILPILMFIPLALASDDEIIKNLDFFENYDVYSSEEYENIISEDEEELNDENDEQTNV